MLFIVILTLYFCVCMQDNKEGFEIYLEFDSQEKLLIIKQYLYTMVVSPVFRSRIKFMGFWLWYKLKGP
jgi:hypothetical protein